jgi:hypothetical protein
VLTSWTRHMTYQPKFGIYTVNFDIKVYRNYPFKVVIGFHGGALSGTGISRLMWFRLALHCWLTICAICGGALNQCKPDIAVCFAGSRVIFEDGSSVGCSSLSAL